MSVIVMGAELPKGYDDCWYLQCDSWKDCYKNGMRNDCPLRPLPEKHGRIVDVGPFEVVVYNRKDHEGESFDDGVVFILEKMDALPTIVEAEGD